MDLLLAECRQGQVTLRLRSDVLSVTRQNGGFLLTLSQGEIFTSALVVATGGLSMPGLGATPFGYRLAQQFGLDVIATRAGVAVPAIVSAEDGTRFRENVLFTHRGLSGPAILQISSFWQTGEFLTIDLLPDVALPDLLREETASHPNQSLKNTLAKLLPRRLVKCWYQLHDIPDISLKQLTPRHIAQWVSPLQQWRVQPNGTEGYRTAEVTLGGVDTRGLSSKTLACNAVPGLYFIGEVVDVIGWLGGYNFQWAWSSAWACAQALARV